MGYSPGNFTAEHIWAHTTDERDYQTNELHWEATGGVITLWYPREVGQVLILSYDQARLCRDQLNTALAAVGED